MDRPHSRHQVVLLPEPKPVEKKPDPAGDPIAEAIKKQEKKPPPKPPVQAAKPPEPAKIKERHFDQSKIAALIDKRDPSRQAVTGETLNSNASLGLSKGRAGDNSATWGAMFRRQVENCWKKPYGGIEQERPEVAFNIRLKKDGTLEAMPSPDGTPSTPYARAYSESALRAIIKCQPYNLPAQFFDEEIPRLVEHGGASSERRADVIFEIVGPEGGRWCLHLGKKPSVERVDPWVQGHLLVRMDEALFPSFLDASLELEPAITAGTLALAGDVDLLGDLAEMWNEPMSMVGLRAKKDRGS